MKRFRSIDRIREENDKISKKIYNETKLILIVITVLLLSCFFVLSFNLLINKYEVILPNWLHIKINTDFIMSEPLKIVITCIFIRWIIYSKRFTWRKNKKPEKVNKKFGEFVKIRSFLMILYFICYIILPLCIFYTVPYKYEIDNDYAVIEKYNGNEFVVTIPRSIDGYEIVEISDFSNDIVTDVTLSDGIKRIRYFAFMGCQSLREIHCNDGLVEIGSSAFYLCNELSDVFISESVTTIGYGAFEGCSDDLTIHGVSGSYAEIYAKENNLNFESI